MDLSSKVYETLEKLETNRQEMQRYYAAIGEKYYKSNTGNVPQEFAEEFLGIQKIEDDNRQLEELIDQEMQIKTCPKCGEKIPAEAVYCPYCRTSVVELKTVDADVSANEPPVCRKCGHKNVVGSRFCSHCGSPLE